jgi:23S rRNA (adenine2030-N6)-methyltransferase
VLADYVALVRRFNDRHGATGAGLKFYPGSPWLAKMLLRPADRMALCELRPDDAEALEFEFAREARVTVQAIDGYIGLKAMLPPPEKRALVLIDPSFENQQEFADIRRGLGEALRRLPGAVCAVWYPITERARADEFHHAVRELDLPALAAELNIAGDGSQLRMKGCGLLVLNPPWQVDGEIRAVLPELVKRLAVDRGAAANCTWLVPER